MIKETLNLVTTKDGEQIAVWKVFDSIRDSTVVNSHAAKEQNVLLTHGTFSDKRVCLGVAKHLAKLGHTCYIMEWRGHGDSSIPKDKFNFETVAFYDLEATFRYLFDGLKLDNLHCVTHSGGGICLTMYLTQKLLIQDTQYIDKINSITMFACQAYGAVLNPKSYARILLIKSITRLLGYLPAKRLKLGTINESYQTMTQWYDWNLNKNFKSSLTKQDVNYQNSQPQNTHYQTSSHDDSFDYRQHMPKITTPIYAISAKGDNFIAPSSGCQLFLNDFNNPANDFREFSISNGSLEDYTHSRIIMSRNASKEIWPTVAAWIEKHGT
ncbi:alpha/beta fold hydrolase [Psychrobacter sp. LV10R520-6]|uniref:alpha/beta fold hydrolase n=1 Tax=Psychrobacter sp. LV10R520-6 TaxID=1415574 RepID=UPI0024C79A6A|nr:alpha/beta hydrolase [Psychrobacter sp. LV10R520-6]SNT70760.1 Pimeloyl-ACP methyl ester carboxylesterase [Psychrobacter sp. LV10R520-6]